MNTQKTLLVLWIIFGFVFVQAIDSILSFLIHFLFLGVVTLKISFAYLHILIPVITVAFYFSAVLLALKCLRINSDTSGILLTRFPKRRFIILLLLAIALHPIENKLSDIFGLWNVGWEDQTQMEFIELYGFMIMGIGVARWISLIALVVIYLQKYKGQGNIHSK